jgi:hypothetical protein
MMRALEGILPRILPEGLDYKLIPHEGKSDLETSIPRKLRAWREPGVEFIVVRDQDAGDCVAVKQHLLTLCVEGGRADTLVRIACRELESWFLGDLVSLGRAFGRDLAREAGKAKFRDPDALGAPYQEIKRLIPTYQKGLGAERMGTVVALEENRSASFRAFVTGVRRCAECLREEPS